MTPQVSIDLDSNFFSSSSQVATFFILTFHDRFGVPPMQFLQLFLSFEDGFQVFEGAHDKLPKCISDCSRVVLIVEIEAAEKGNEAVGDGETSTNYTYPQKKSWFVGFANLDQGLADNSC